MEAKCVVCHTRLAAFRCIQCHKPVCDECAFKDDNGAFCCRECAASYRSFKQAEARAPVHRESKGGRGILLLIVILALAAFAVWKLKLLRLPGREPTGTGQPGVERPAPRPAGPRRP